MHSFHSIMYMKLVEVIKLIKMFSIRAPQKKSKLWMSYLPPRRFIEKYCLSI